MPEFFIALFGGIYYIAKISSDRSKTNDADRRIKERIDFNFGLADRVTDDDVEREIDAMLSDPNCRNNVYEELSENLNEIYGENYREKFILPSPYDPSAVCGNGFWAKHLLLSKRGKVSWLRYMSGFHLGFASYVNENIAMCKQVEKNLLKAGTGLRLVLQPSGMYDSPYRWDPAGKKMVFEHQLCCSDADKSKARLW